MATARVGTAAAEVWEVMSWMTSWSDVAEWRAVEKELREG
jgi:hypothetical protein